MLEIKEIKFDPSKLKWWQLLLMAGTVIYLVKDDSSLLEMLVNIYKK